MPLFLFWLACSLLASLAIILTETWAYYHPKPGTEPVKPTTNDVMLGIVTAIFPILNIVVFIVGIYYLFMIVVPELRE